MMAPCCSSLKTARRPGRPEGVSNHLQPPQAHWRLLDKAPLACVRKLEGDCELAVYSNERRCLIFHTALLSPKTTRTTQGVAVMTLKAKYHLETVKSLEETAITNFSRYRVRSIPAAGALVREEDSEERQLDLLNGQKEEI